ncbi:MAG TPA: hypothetical protein VJZ91_10625 [Blastocatellia bacterium]|nr:hypothetical protein [Blastocatellia bacterium]
MMTVDYEAQQAAQAQLDAGERLLWYGRPDPKRQLFGSLFVLLFGIPWTAFALFWTAAASGLVWGELGFGWHSLFALWGVPFVLVGFGMLSSPYWTYRKAKRTVYAVTSRRALIISGTRERKVQSFAARDIGLIERTERGNGKGDVMFASSASDKTPQRIGFTGIADARRVERLLLDTFKRDPEETPAEDITSHRFSPFGS